MPKPKLSYAEQLKHPNWQRKRLEMLDAAGWACGRCDAKETTLHVHHKQYMKGRMAWEYSSDELEVLCETCHLDEHDAEEVLKRILAIDAGYRGSCVGLAGGLLAGYLLAGFDLSPEMEAECRRVFPRGMIDVGVIAWAAATSTNSQLVKAIEALRHAKYGLGPVLEEIEGRVLVAASKERESA